MVLEWYCDRGTVTVELSLYCGSVPSLSVVLSLYCGSVPLLP